MIQSYGKTMRKLLKLYTPPSTPESFSCTDPFDLDQLRKAIINNISELDVSTRNSDSTARPKTSIGSSMRAYDLTAHLRGKSRQVSHSKLTVVADSSGLD